MGLGHGAGRQAGADLSLQRSELRPQCGELRCERRIGEFRRRKTLMFNGYGDQVARLYSGMDLRKFF